MTINKIEIIPIKPQKGLIAFASIEINNHFYFGSIGIHKKLDGSGYRVTYPTKKVGEQNITICHPTCHELSKEIEEAISQKMTELFGNSNF